MNLLVRIGTDLKTVMPPAVSRPRFGEYRVSTSSCHDGLVGFNGVLATHLLGVDAGHGQAAESLPAYSTIGL
jgi:hypothetical protein